MPRPEDRSQQNSITRRTVLKATLASAAAASSLAPALARATETAPLRQTAQASSPSASGKAKPSRTSPIAATTNGKVRGYTDSGIHIFKGIPYGADTARTRFMPPRPPRGWSTVRDALEYGPASPQPGKGEPTSENCLYLNVWTPALRGNADPRASKPRPVMVYIHGGAYSRGSGSSPLYDGARLCRRGDVVVVTVNHRLAALGYLYLARLEAEVDRTRIAETRLAGTSLADSGNAGMLDLVLALQWVRDNIAEFGGDPSNVMLFGQSGGGAKIATLMAMPAARGLFHRAATMSGQQLTASGPLNATTRAKVFIDALKLSPERIDDLRSLPIEKLIAAHEATDPIIGRGSLYFGPVLDDRTLPRHPFYPDAPPQSAHIPMMIGNTHDETRGLIGASDPATFNLTWDQLAARLLPEMRIDITPEKVVAEYRRLYPSYTPTDVFFSATTASRSWRAAIVEAELRAQQGAPVYAYQLDWKSPIDDGKWGAPHTLDIPLVFGTLDAQGSITGTADSAQNMSAQMADAFIAFARTGNPNTPSVPTWTPYSLARRETLVFNVPSKLVDDPRGDERRLFAAVPFIQQGT